MFERAGKIVAIEVKSGSNFTTSSLNNLKIKYPQLKFERIVISNKALSEKIVLDIYQYIWLLFYSVMLREES